MVPSPSRPSRRERQRRRNREEILEAARQVLELRGLEGLTIEEVARRAEFAVGSIYRYFESKGDLVDMLHVEVLRPFLDEVEAIAAQDGPFEASLTALLEAFASYVTEALPALEIIVGLPPEVVPSSGAARQRLHEASEQLVQDVRRLIVQGQAQGVLVDEDPETMAILLVGMAMVFGRRAARGCPTDLPAAMQVVRRVFLDGFRATP